MSNEWKCPVKPEEIPTCLNWVAQDESGEWCGYVAEPIADDEFCVWVEDTDVYDPGGEYLFTGEYNANWRNTLQKIPR